MLKRPKKLFNGKILLFGEHLINKGGRGLAMPAPVFNGRLRFSKPVNEDKRHTSPLLPWLQWMEENNSCRNIINTTLLREDLSVGLVFDSNIPEGYGAGSSGALTAAVYHAYRLKKHTIHIPTIKHQLSVLESFFHGKSSGLDPLVSFLNYAVSVTEKNITEVHIPSGKNNPSIFVLDTSIRRSTEDWVKLFLQKCRQESFLNIVQESMIPISDSCIQFFLAQKEDRFFNSLKLLSQLQFDYMRDFIPHHLHTIWAESLSKKDYALKICGAGGGGFILCFAKAEQSKVEQQIKHALIRVQ